MPSLLAMFGSVQFWVFCLGIYVVVLIARKLLERIPGLAENHWWNEAILPLLPPLFGAVVALVATAYPFPAGITSVSARVMFGMVCGFFSGLGYRIAWAYVNKMLADKGIDISQFESMAPTAKLVSIMPGAKPPTLPPPPPPKTN